MDFTTIIYEKKEDISHIKMNRPRVLNALNKQFWLEFPLALEDSRYDSSIKIIIITGEGTAFSAGADIKESTRLSMEEYQVYLSERQEFFKRMIRFEKPIIAVINGYAIGLGAELALACDLRVASETATIGFPEARISSSMTSGSMRLLQNLVFKGRTKQARLRRARIRLPFRRLRSHTRYPFPRR